MLYLCRADGLLCKVIQLKIKNILFVKVLISMTDRIFKAKKG